MPRRPRERYRRRLRFCGCICVVLVLSILSVDSAQRSGPRSDSDFCLAEKEKKKKKKKKKKSSRRKELFSHFQGTVQANLRPRFGFPLKSLSGSIA